MEMQTANQIASNIDNAAKLVLPVNSSARELASILGTVRKQLLFSDILNEVAPSLLEALLITPHATQASYIGLDGLFFSYYKNNDKIYAAYSNSTFLSLNSSTSGYTWYTQSVDSNSGKLFGEIKTMEPVAIVNETWFQSALNSTIGYASLGFSWTNRDDGPDLFLDTAGLDGKGVVSLGYTVKRITDLFYDINFNGGSLYMATINDPGRIILQGNKGTRFRSTGDTALVLEGSTDKIVGEISCKTKNGFSVATNLKIEQTEFIFYCSQIDVARVALVYVFAFPSNWGLVGDVHKHTKVALILLIVMMVAVLISVFVFVTLIVRATWREVHLCSAYMRQMDKTSQAERKSLKQSLAFASANHDVRGYLACIKGLIDLCYSEVSPTSELASNFKKIDTCTDDLLAMVNSILDFSKIEAGKMQLEEGGFNLEQLLEDIADLHHPVAMKKGIEVILDPCDGSILKFSSVIGDRGKLKQILSNLLSNAVKYTPSGHISIRAWVKKPSLENSIITSNKNSFLNRLSHIFYRNKQAYNDLEDMKMINHDSNSMEFVFEVEDTGLGIPKDKRKSIFEDFVQVKENSSGQVGTGLGLGIVQSLVRLMGGDIEIVDKANGEAGTCFRFNIFLIVQENPSLNSPRLDKVQYQDTYPSPRVEGSIAVLLMKHDERRRMVQRYMESLGIKVIVLRQVNRIPHALKKKLRINLINTSQCYSSSSGSFMWSPSSGPKLLPLSSFDGADDGPSVCKPSFPGTVRCIMLILDANAGNFQEMCRSVAQLRKDNLDSCIKVVWLERPETRRAHFPGLADESLSPTDCIIQEPFHGNHLFRVVELLPEFGGELVKASTRKMRSTTVFPYHQSSESEGEKSILRAHSMNFRRSDSTRWNSFLSFKSFSCHRELTTTRLDHGEIEEDNVSASNNKSSTPKYDAGPKTPSLGPLFSDAQSTGGPGLNKKPLDGKNFLIADDYLIGRMVATSLITHLGGHAEVCENGKEALELICNALNNIGGEGPSKFPYDYVLMDCQMPVMDGFEATTRIRQEEKKYGIHIPIIALTADEAGEAGNKITEAGMDFHMTKPLKKEVLLEVMGRI
ncbi:histidine kinase CKI1-like [Silene latifolia]|uniref:histidine kinase CKI1-like n=1 Tax=Silene latifolia TaxID=37657 RepID=UPI003D787506